MAQQSPISLDQKQQDLINRLVRSGRYDGAYDVVAAGLRLVEEHEAQSAAFIGNLEAEIEAGLASGDALPMETADRLLAEFRRGQ
jgi:antitoxin ParD1/3/4